MDARVRRGLMAAAALLSLGAGYRTPNFVVNAPTAEIAQQVGQAAEKYRKELAIRWLGKEMPRWSNPCPIRVKVGDLGAGGTTTFACSHGEVYHWNMVVQGTLDRILDSVLPHEVNHTVLASHFRRPLVRWADEGASTLVEDALEHQRQQRILRGLLSGRRMIPLAQLLNMKEYPRNIAALYSQGYCLTRYLVQLGGHGTFLEFLDDGRRQGWDAAIRAHYRTDGVDQLERKWLAWVRDGARDLVTPDADRALASAGRLRRPEPNIIYRGQTPDEDDESQATGAGPSQRWGTHERSPGALAHASRPKGSLSPNSALTAQAFPAGDGLPGGQGWAARGRRASGIASRHDVPPPSRIAVAAASDATSEGWSVDGNEGGWHDSRTGRPAAPATNVSSSGEFQASPLSDPRSGTTPAASPWSAGQEQGGLAIAGDAEPIGIEDLPRSEPIRRAPPERRVVAAPRVQQPRRAPVRRPVRRRVIRGPVVSWPGSGST